MTRPDDQPIEAAPDIDALRNILDTLVPPSKVTVTDATGAEHRLPGALPARRQIKVMRELEALKDRAADSRAFQSFAETVKTGKAAGDSGAFMADALDVIVSLANDDDVLDSLARAFTLAHPQAVKVATENGKEWGLESADPADLFPIEEIVAGLLPFFIRLLKRSAQALTAFSQATGTAA